MAQKSAPKGFSKGLITDVDPRYQLEGSYRDAMNIKLVSSEGSTFTVENINGNKQVLDLDTIEKHLRPPYASVSTSPQNYFKDTGGAPLDIGDANGAVPMRGAANIVGHFSFKNQLLLIVCGYLAYNLSSGSQAVDDFRTVFFLIDFDADGNVEKCTDLRVCYSALGNQWPNLNMDPLIKCRVEGIIENEAISRVYWTDNKNPLRTFSLNDPNLHELEVGELDISPKSNHNQITLQKTISGSLPVGVYQYCYKYLTDSGGESGISPFSNLYHISNASNASSALYYGGDPGEQSSDGFLLKITDLDLRYDSILIYAIYYPSLGSTPMVSEVIEKNINANGEVSFNHTALTTVIENGVENILIPSNTWDLCKDIAIKDNVLFAANLRSKKNFITEKEWNVKLLRYQLNLTNGSLTTTDSNVKDYYCPAPYDPDDVVEANSATSYVKLHQNGTGHEGAHRYLPDLGLCQHGQFNQFAAPSGDLGRKILGGQSYGYYGTSGGATGTNALGGVMMTFRMEPKISDTRDNRGGVNDGATEFISTNTPNENIQTDNLAGSSGGTNNTSTEYTASFTVGSNKDPHASGNKRGYQRGETYRFGVLVYDKNGDPGNVLWMGDIQMPEHHDKAWELDLENTQLGRNASHSSTVFRENPIAQDYRISAHANCPVPGAHRQYDTTTRFNPSTNNSPKTAQRFFTPDGSDGSHYTMDLCVDFTFKIPQHVREKISGFRVVRAQRDELDRTILQSGLINQIINYGDKDTPGEGYAGHPDVGIVNPAAVDVEAGDHSTVSDDAVDEIYDSYLNGYCGVNAMSRRIVFDDSTNNEYYVSEAESSMGGSSKQDFASCAEFGSFNLGCHFKGSDSYITTFAARKTVLMYSPDSAFGVRPYSFNSEHKFVNVCTLKLYNQTRHDLYESSTDDPQYQGEKVLGHYDIEDHSNLSNNVTNIPTDGTSSSKIFHHNNKETGLTFYTKKTTKDNESGVMVGKCFVYDTYQQHYKTRYDHYSSSNPVYVHDASTYYERMFDTAYTAVDFAYTGTTFASYVNPNTVIPLPGSSRRIPGNEYISPILAAKEIGDGEFIPKSFFKSSSGTNQWYVEHRGFSNFSLGAGYLRGSETWQYGFNYGKIENGELDYETVSTVQMGTRAIIIDCNDEIANVLDLGAITRHKLWQFTKSGKKKINNPGVNGDVLQSINHQPIPFYAYGNIVKENDGQYGGDSLEAIQKTRWINAGNYHPININNIEHHSTVFGGDTFVGLYSHQITTSPYPEKSYSKWIVFPCESYVNTEMRSGYHLAANDHIEGFDQDTPPFSNDWFYNTVYSQENDLKSYLAIQDEDQEYRELPVEIAYSKTKLAGEQADAFRVFPIFNFYNVEAIYGQINRLINFQNEIHFLQENAIGQLLVNPRTFLQDTSGVESIFTGSGDTVESHQYISIKYGTQHMHSVVASERNLFFFDINYAKLLKYTSDKKLVSISDDLGTRDLFEKATKYGRLKLQDRYEQAPRVNKNDMPLYFVGIHGAFDYSTNTLYMTFADRLRIDNYDGALHPSGDYVMPIDVNGVDIAYGTEPENPGQQTVGGYAYKYILSSTVAYNEDIDAVISRYSVYPQQWIEHQGKLYTPKSRIPWLSYGSGGGLNVGFANNDTTAFVFGQELSGVYGEEPDFMRNYARYTYGAHELGSGSVQLWQWEGSNEKTRFFEENMLHAPDDASSVTPPDYEQNIEYPVFEEDGTEITQQGVGPIIHQSFIEKIVNDVPSENKKFDNLSVVSTVGYFSRYMTDIFGEGNRLAIERGVESTDAGLYFENLSFETDFNTVQTIDIATENKPFYPTTTSFEDTLHKYREGVLRIPLRNNSINRRAVGTYLRARLTARTTEKFNIFAIMAKYRKSYN
jgi:hypothetical protein